MPRTEIYFKSWCPYSQRALSLLKSKGVDFKAIDLTNDADELEQQMRTRSGRTSVPQIFIDGRHLGGYDDIAALDAAGELDPLLFAGDALKSVSAERSAPSNGTAKICEEVHGGS